MARFEELDAPPLVPQYQFRGVRQSGPYTFVDVDVFVAAQAEELGHFRAELKIPLRPEDAGATYAELRRRALELAREIVQTQGVLPLLSRR